MHALLYISLNVAAAAAEQRNDGTQCRWLLSVS